MWALALRLLIMPGYVAAFFVSGAFLYLHVTQRGILQLRELLLEQCFCLLGLKGVTGMLQRAALRLVIEDKADEVVFFIQHEDVLFYRYGALKALSVQVRACADDAAEKGTFQRMCPVVMPASQARLNMDELGKRS